MLFHASPRERYTLALSVEQLMLVASLFWALSANGLFLSAALNQRDLSQPGTWGFASALLVMLAAMHYLILCVFSTRHTVKPLLVLLIVGTAFATYFMQSFNVYLDPTMLRNVMRTDVAEARELFAWRLVRIVARPLLRAALQRVGSVFAALVLLVGPLMLIFQPFASMMRNHKDMRYLATPANYLYSIGAVAAAQAKGAAKPRQAIGLDAKPGPAYAARSKPLLVVMVVGETARAANWGLNGYARQTTPELAALAATEPLVSYGEVASCGTNTEVSLPCMFAPVGRRDYDEATIRGSESLLHVLARAGVGVSWRDNQSGCKGVCEGLPQDNVMDLKLSGLCADGRCLDEGLLAGLPERLAALKAKPATQFLVLHMLGNHGPSYFRRYPPAFKRFVPACEFDDLHKCSREQIVNAYDNALLYTDHVLARLVAQLQSAAGAVDSAVLFVSDHGESLGENNLYLHGLPYAIAPDLQKRVPMLLWLSAGAPRSLGLDVACLQRRAKEPAAHDHLFHTLLGLVDVKTALYDPKWDLAQGCRVPPAAP
jgi:lipid A ethanolaminephosphotransferase